MLRQWMGLLLIFGLCGCRPVDVLKQLQFQADGSGSASAEARVDSQEDADLLEELGRQAVALNRLFYPTPETKPLPPWLKTSIINEDNGGRRWSLSIQFDNLEDLGRKVKEFQLDSMLTPVFPETYQFRREGDTCTFNTEVNNPKPGSPIQLRFRVQMPGEIKEASEPAQVQGNTATWSVPRTSIWKPFARTTIIAVATLPTESPPLLSPPLKKRWQPPLKVPWRELLGFRGENDKYFPGKLHVAQDLGVPEGTPVYPIADGVVKYAQRNATYGHAPEDPRRATAAVVIIEHEGNDGPFCALYGHLKITDLVPLGPIRRDQIIGYIASQAEIYPYSPPHLHFGLRRGPYDEKNDWKNRLGYLEESVFPEQWKDPLPFLKEVPTNPEAEPLRD